MPTTNHTADPIRPPSALLALTELPRALAEFASLAPAAPLLATAPRGDGHSVMVLPGFLTTDASTSVMRRYLRQLGYDACAWELGRNLGPRAIGREGEKLIDRIQSIHDRTGQKVSLVGWSLGGVLARLAARRVPEAVRQIVTLGSPFAGNPRATNVWRTYQFMSGQRIDDLGIEGRQITLLFLSFGEQHDSDVRTSRRKRKDLAVDFGAKVFNF